MNTEEVDLLNKTGMTAKEKELISMTVDLWNNYVQLPETHPMERSEFARKIHEIQNHIASRHVFAELNSIHYSDLEEHRTPRSLPKKQIPPADQEFREGGDISYIGVSAVILLIMACFMAVCSVSGWGWFLAGGIVCFGIKIFIEE